MYLDIKGKRSVLEIKNGPETMSVPIIVTHQLEAKSTPLTKKLTFIWISCNLQAFSGAVLYQEKMENFNWLSITNLLSFILAGMQLRSVNGVWSDNKIFPWQPSGFNCCTVGTRE